LPPEVKARDGGAASTLHNVLLLEQRRGYDDRAVVGGLAVLLARLGQDSQLSHGLLHEMSRYRERSAEERADLVNRALRAMVVPAAGPSLTDELARPPTAGGSITRPRARSTGATPPGVRRMSPDTPVGALTGVGPARAKRLAILGITTVSDLRLHFPHRYVAYPPPQPASGLGFQHLASFVGEVSNVDVANLPGRRIRITATLQDATGRVGAVWIRAASAPPGIRRGVRLAVSGPLVRYGRQVYFENPEYEPAEAPPLNTRRIVPVYPLTSGLSQPFMRGIIRRALESLSPIDEWLPGWLCEQNVLLPRDSAIHELHWPASEAQMEQARRRFAFDELLPIQLMVLQRRQAYRAAASLAIEAPWGLLADMRQRLPFALTGGQQRALSAILEDVAQTRPMLRLLQGEVGSGKTVVAAIVLLAAVLNGGQAAVVAPTEILAEQHFRTLSDLYGGVQPAIERALGRPLRLATLTGALSRVDRLRTLDAIATGEVDLVVGTHAVIQPDVEFARLLLAVVDEQHRFGVSQRVAVRQKGQSPHLLMMTATPIPRTLALTLYGDLDVSVIDELPAGRRPVETVLLRPPARDEAYERVRSAAATGRQAFVICPLVEGSQAVEARAATSEYERLQRAELAGLRLALLHGRMRPAEKDAVMQAFAQGEYDVLVSTSVVEVGIDVPRATVMLIEGAERFGLAQLHQFRGRVARSTEAAICFLIAGSDAPESLDRLEAVVRSGNGLELAEEDLRLRGPGEYYGLRQSGFPDFRVARLNDLALIQEVREAATQLLEQDPALESPEHQALADAVRGLAASAAEAN